MNRIKELRLEKKYSMEQLARKVGVGKSSISQYESELRSPSTETQEALSDVFNVDVDYLMGRTSIKRRVDLEGVIKNEISSKETELIKAYRKAPTPTKQAIDVLLGVNEDENEDESDSKKGGGSESK